MFPLFYMADGVFSRLYLQSHTGVLPLAKGLPNTVNFPRAKCISTMEGFAISIQETDGESNASECFERMF